jgi:hypothetical protein
VLRHVTSGDFRYSLANSCTRPSREQVLQTHVAAKRIGQPEVRRRIDSFQRSLPHAGGGPFHIGPDHRVANFRRHLRHEF